MSSNDFDLMFGRLALRLQLINASQLKSVEQLAANQPTAGFAALMLAQGLITVSQRNEVQQRVDQLVSAYNGDVEKVLIAIEEVGPSPASADDSGAFEATVIGAPTIARKSPDDSDFDQITAPFEATIIASRPDDSSDSEGSGADGDESNRGSSDTRLRSNMAETVDRRGGGKSPFGATLSATSDARVSLRLDLQNTEPSQRSRYTLTHVCGKGGVGEVWLAKDPHLNRDIALKKFRSDRNEDVDARLRLIKEAQITGQLEHPNIIPVHELDRMEDGSPYYTMKLLRGQTLSDRIKAYHRKRKSVGVELLELHDLLNVFVDVCNAIAYSGARGIVHRDLKPANIMLGDFGEVLVLDWGLATIVGQAEANPNVTALKPEDIVDPTQTAEGQIVGTPAYMAPEQASGRISRIDHRTDVYGLGSVLYAMLVGIAPHKGEQTGNTVRDTLRLLEKIIHEPTPSPREVNPSVPAPLEERSHTVRDGKSASNKFVRPGFP